MPLIKISSEKEMDADILFSPKVADPTEKVKQEDKPALKSRESGAQASLRESESEGNSMGVLYQSSMGSLHQDSHQHGRNGTVEGLNTILELESRLNSPLLTGNGFVSPAYRTSFYLSFDAPEMDMLDPTRFMSSNYATPLPLSLNPTFFNANSTGILPEPPDPRGNLASQPSLPPSSKLDASPPFGASMLHPPMQSAFQESMLNLSLHPPRDSVILNEISRPSLPLYPASSPLVTPVSSSSLSTLPFDSAERPSLEESQQAELQSRIPSYIREAVQSHKDFPLSYNRLLAAKLAQIPGFPAETLSFAQLQRFGMQEPFVVNGVFPGCSYPLDSLSLSFFMQQLGEFYEGSVQMVRTARGGEA